MYQSIFLYILAFIVRTVKKITEMPHSMELSEKYEKLALEYLGETRSVREKSLKEFEKWIKGNKKIVSCPTGNIIFQTPV